jgi:hypothetical protein
VIQVDVLRLRRQPLLDQLSGPGRPDGCAATVQDELDLVSVLQIAESHPAQGRADQSSDQRQHASLVFRQRGATVLARRGHSPSANSSATASIGFRIVAGSSGPPVGRRRPGAFGPIRDCPTLTPRLASHKILRTLS